MDPLLNSYQKASLTNVLRMFEEKLLRALVVLDGQEFSGTLYKTKVDISESESEYARKIIFLALNEIKVLAEKLNLEGELENPIRLISAQMSLAWADLLSSQAKEMKGYGEVHPFAGQVIDPHIQKLAQMAMNLAVLFSSNQK